MLAVPPKHLIIRDDSGREVYDIAGPFRERSDISLSCEAQKGNASNLDFGHICHVLSHILYNVSFSNIDFKIIL